jgi:hypothetical protein
MMGSMLGGLGSKNKPEYILNEGLVR